MHAGVAWIILQPLLPGHLGAFLAGGLHYKREWEGNVLGSEGADHHKRTFMAARERLQLS
jgi:hypothetical protein